MRERLQFVRIIIGVYVSAEMERWQFVGIIANPTLGWFALTTSRFVCM